MDVWIVTMEAVYDHGCAGVFTSEEAAREHAQALAADSDGHHDFRIERFALDDPVWIDGRWLGWTKRRKREASVRVMREDGFDFVSDGEAK